MSIVGLSVVVVFFSFGIVSRNLFLSQHVCTHNNTYMKIHNVNVALHSWCFVMLVGCLHGGNSKRRSLSMATNSTHEVVLVCVVQKRCNMCCAHTDNASLAVTVVASRYYVSVLIEPRAVFFIHMIQSTRRRSMCVSASMYFCWVSRDWVCFKFHVACRCRYRSHGTVCVPVCYDTTTELCVCFLVSQTRGKVNHIIAIANIIFAAYVSLWLLSSCVCVCCGFGAFSGTCKTYKRWWQRKNGIQYLNSVRLIHFGCGVPNHTHINKAHTFLKNFAVSTSSFFGQRILDHPVWNLWYGFFFFFVWNEGVFLPVFNFVWNLLINWCSLSRVCSQ